MNWKKKIAKEWIWLICTYAGVFLANIILFSTTTWYWEEMRYIAPQRQMILMIWPVAFVYFIRLTIWAIKELRKPEREAEKNRAKEAALETLAKEPEGKGKKTQEDKKSKEKRTITFGGFFGNKYCSTPFFSDQLVMKWIFKFKLFLWVSQYLTFIKMMFIHGIYL